MQMVSVIVPTFNERKNMRPLIKRIDSSIKHMKHEIIIVDDNSQDGTGQAVRELSKKYPVRLIVRTKEKGLATAVMEGFRQAKGDIYAVIDADLQHPPEKLASLIYEARNGSDIAIGSRYVGGEERFGNFRIHRKIMSKGANLLAKLLVPKVANIKDIQSGFFAMKRDVIQDVELKPTGYKILLEILAVGNYKNVKEVPYDFAQREHGKSKLGASIIFDYIHHLITLTFREKESQRFVKFLATGFAGVIIGVMLLWFMTEKVGIFYLISAGVSKEFGILLAFAANELWVFNDRISSSMKSTKDYAIRLVKFNANRLLAIFIVIATMAILTEFMGINYLISNIIGIGIAFPLNYLACNKRIWKKERKDNNAQEEKENSGQDEKKDKDWIQKTKELFAVN